MFLNKVQSNLHNIYISALTVILLPCYRIKGSSTFPTRLGAATKEFKGREVWFQIRFFQFKSIFVGSVIADLLGSK